MQRTFHLESGESETLKVVPTRKVLSVSTFSKGGSVEKVGNVINLYFEGNWMPIKVWRPLCLRMLDACQTLGTSSFGMSANHASSSLYCLKAIAAQVINVGKP